MQYFPAFIDLQQQRVLVVGGGEVAARKVELVVAAGALVVVVSPEIGAPLQRLVASDTITWQPRSYDIACLADTRLCFACTDKESLNRQIHADCEQRGILVNVVDNPPLCRFITPSMVNRHPIQIAIASGGQAPVLVRFLRERLEALLSPAIGELGAFAGRMRTTVKAALPTVDARRRFWERFFSGPAAETRDEVERKRLFHEALAVCRGEPVAGSLSVLSTDGNPDRITLGALRVMQQADVVYYPIETSQAVLELIRRDAERVQLEPTFKLQPLANRYGSGERILIIIPNNAKDLSIRIQKELIAQVSEIQWLTSPPR